MKIYFIFILLFGILSLQIRATHNSRLLTESDIRTHHFWVERQKTLTTVQPQQHFKITILLIVI